MLIHLIAVAPLAFLSCPWTHPVPCSHRRSCSFGALFWLSASTISVSRWSAQTMDQHGNITLASPNPCPWRSTCGLEWSLPISHVGIHRRGSALWWVWTGSLLALLLCQLHLFHWSSLCFHANIVCNHVYLWYCKFDDFSEPQKLHSKFIPYMPLTQCDYYCEFGCESVYQNLLKGQKQTKKIKMYFIHPHVNSKHVWLSFFCGTQKKIFRRMLVTKQFWFAFTSIVWLIYIYIYIYIYILHIWLSFFCWTQFLKCW